MNYVFAGSDNTAAQVLEALCEDKPPSLVITREDAPFGRKKELRATRVADIAEKRNIELIKANDPAVALSEIRRSGCQTGIVVSYGAILKGEVLNSLQWFNLHFSLLPKLRGAAPVQRAILNNDLPTGVTVFRIDEGMDTGPIFKQLEVDISGQSTEQALYALAEASIPVLRSLLESSTPEVVEQFGEPSYAPKLDREECKLNFNLPAEQLHRVVLAAYPEPVAWASFRGHPLRVLGAATSGIQIPDDSKPIGTVEKVGKRIYVVCGNSTRLELLEVQPFSKKPMRALDWFNGVGEAVFDN